MTWIYFILPFQIFYVIICFASWNIFINLIQFPYNFLSPITILFHQFFYFYVGFAVQQMSQFWEGFIKDKKSLSPLPISHLQKDILEYAWKSMKKYVFVCLPLLFLKSNVCLDIIHFFCSYLSITYFKERRI